MNDQILLSYHEAAHSVAAKALGQQVLSVTIEPETHIYGRCLLDKDTIDAEQVPLILLAAPVAEQRYRQESGIEGDDACDECDFALLFDLLSKRWPKLHRFKHDQAGFMADPNVAALLQRARGIVGRNWGATEDIADRLQRVGTLAGEELGEYLDHVQVDPLYLQQRQQLQQHKLRKAQVAVQKLKREPRKPKPDGQRWVGTHQDREAAILRLGGSPDRFGSVAVKALQSELAELQQRLPALPAGPARAKSPIVVPTEPRPAAAPAPEPRQDTGPDHVVVDEITRVADRPRRARITHDDGSVSYVEIE